MYMCSVHVPSNSTLSLAFYQLGCPPILSCLEYAEGNTDLSQSVHIHVDALTLYMQVHTCTCIYYSDVLYRSFGSASSVNSSIPLTGDSRADADIIAFYRARQKLIQKGQCVCVCVRMHACMHV